MRILLPPMLLAAALCGGALFVACAEGEAPEPAPSAPPPADAVVQIGPGEYLAEPVYIHAAEIDHWVPTIARIEPDETERSWRRKALTNVNLPIAVIEAVFPEERSAAYEQILALREHLVAGRELPEGAPATEKRAGHALDHQLHVWGTVTGLEQGEWSDVLAIPGGYVVARAVTGPPPGGFLPNVILTVETLTVRYVPLEEIMAIAEDARVKLPIHALEPAGWEGILPAYYEYE